jgi:hypothetical protein
LSPGELLELTRYVIYRTAWRHAPRLLRHVERRGHALRNRRLARRLLRVSVRGEPALTVTWTGWDEALFGYLKQRLGDGVEVVECGSLRALQAQPELEPGFGVDLAFVEVPDWRAPAFSAEGWLILPKRVSHLEDLRPAAGGESRRARAIERAIERRGLRCEVSKRASDLEAFHREFYLPMLRRRHADQARATSLPLLRAIHRRGWLLRVLERGRWVSGALLAPHALWQDAMSIVVVGVRDGDYQAIADAARAAPVFFAREEARRRGARVCDHLVTRPFLNDGLFRRKRRWETRVHDLAERPDRLALRVSGDRPGLLRWLADNPFLACSDGGLVAVGWGDAGRDRAAELAVPGVLARYTVSSLADLRTLAMTLGSGMIGG